MRGVRGSHFKRRKMFKGGEGGRWFLKGVIGGKCKVELMRGQVICKDRGISPSHAPRLCSK